jgi:integrase
MGVPIKLTKRIIDAMKPPKRGSKLLRDTEVAGFGIRVQSRTRLTPQGKRSFYFNYHSHGFERRITIGQWPTWTCEAARERAKELRKAVDRGEDPAVEKRERREAPTITDLADRYKRDHLPNKSKHSQVEDERTIDTRILPRLGRRLVAEVHQGDVVALHKWVTDNHGPVRANRVLAVLSKMFSLSLVPCEGETKAWRTADLGNPCKGVKRNTEDGRERFYSPSELAAIGDALATYYDQAKADCVRFIMLTGCRPNEAMHAKKTQIENGIWSKPASATKQRKAHRVPLSPPALEIVARRQRGEFLFEDCQDDRQSLRECWDHVRKVTKIDGRLYDLRHSYASLLAAGGASLIIIGKLLGHGSPKTTQRYVHLTDDPLRDAAGKVGDTISASLKRQHGEVIPMKR